MDALLFCSRCTLTLTLRGEENRSACLLWPYSMCTWGFRTVHILLSASDWPDVDVNLFTSIEKCEHKIGICFH